MRCDIFPDYQLDNYKSFEPYMFAYTNRHLKRHEDDWFSVGVFDCGDTLAHVVAYDKLRRKEAAEMFNDACDRVQNHGGKLGEIVSFIVYLDVEPDDTVRSVEEFIDALAKGVKAWTKDAQRIACLCSHVKQRTKDMLNIQAPHVHVMYERQGNESNSLQQYLLRVLDKGLE